MSPAKARRGSLVAQIRAAGGLVIAVVSTKGGVGKTTVAWNLAHELAQRGARVLLIDTDPQRTVSDADAVRQIPRRVTVMHYPHVSIWEDIARLRAGYDVVVIDGHAKHDRLARAVAVAAAGTEAADEPGRGVILTPIKVGPEALWGFERGTAEILRDVRKAYGRITARSVLTEYRETEILTASTRDAVARDDIAPLTTQGLERHVTYGQAIAGGLAVCEYEPRGAAAADVAALTTEVIKLALAA